MTEPAADLARRTPDALHSITIITITYSDGSQSSYNPAHDRCPYPISIRVEQTTSVIAPGLSERVG